MKTLASLATCWLIAVGVYAADPQWFSFGNHSTNDLYVTRVLCDGKEFPIPVGILIPGGSKASSDMFPRKMPVTFTVLFRKDSQSLTQDVSGKEVSQLLKHAPAVSDVTVHFLYSERGKFIPKVEARNRRSIRPDEVKLWPDESDPRFQKHKTLARAAYDGKADEVRKALDDGAPYSWPDNPIGLSALEWTVRWNHEGAFDELMKALPLDYSTYRYANCIKLASQDGRAAILTKLLTQPLANAVPPRVLQEIFYSACYSAKTPESLETLLKHYPVGVDFRVRDYGHTLLFTAVQGRNHAIVEWLVNHGANKSLALQNGSKPIDWARDERMRQILTQP